MSDLYRQPGWLACVGRVCAEPRSDELRLAAADWLDEHGDPTRADFIHAQLELARIQEVEPERGTRSREIWHLRCWLPAWNRYRSIPDLEARLAEWIAPIRPEWRPEFRRGFVERLTLSAVDWLKHADALVKTHPIAEVEFTALPTQDELSEWSETPVQLPEAGTAPSEDWSRLVIDSIRRYWPRVSFSLSPARAPAPVSPGHTPLPRKPKILASSRRGDCPNCGGNAEPCSDGALRCYSCGLRI